MLFTEPAFMFAFLPLTLLAYYAAPRVARNSVLVVASILYYSWGESHFLPFLIGSIILNYYFALAIEKYRGQRLSKVFLVLGITSDLALLIVFKYAEFIGDNLSRVLALVHLSALHVKHIILPLGISFFTFHKISYKVDVYRADADAKRSGWQLALYILLFPQLIAGPIVRYHEIDRDLGVRHETMRKFAYGIERFVWGLGKKVLIANSVAMAADRIFSLPASGLPPAVAWLGIVCYSLQLFFDFSGYSDMAIGLAGMFGFHFPENFNYPYIATSITEFWHRWHMTLSRFFRDYLYIPLGGNRVSKFGVYRNLFTVFFLCGLWHGASWNFVVWGLFHGIFLVIERVGLGPRLKALPSILQHAYALLVVMIGWVFFRAPSLGYALQFLSAMFGGHPQPAQIDPSAFLDPVTWLGLGAGIFLAGPYEGMSRRLGRHVPAPSWETLQLGLRLAGLGGILLVSTLLMAGKTYSPFIYYRF